MTQHIMGFAVTAVLAAVVGFVVGLFLSKNKFTEKQARLEQQLANAEQTKTQAQEQIKTLQTEQQRLYADNGRLEAQLDAQKTKAEEQIKTITEAKEALTHQFKTLSQEILEEKSQRFTEQSQASLKPILDPLKEHIGRFEKQVREAYDNENIQRSALSEQINQLQKTNQHISEDATNLANALRGESKTQGNWGEMILETVLEQSGLEKGRQYETQFAATDEQGKRYMPDAVIHLPGGRSIIIDSKVSLTAHVQAHEAESEAGRQQALKAHIQSVRQHLKDLSKKAYQNLPEVKTLDYVFMFVPSEAAYVEALRNDFALQREALDKNIALVSPTTLMPMLRAVANLWRLQKQEENAADIARKAGALYDKFVGYLDDLDKLGRALESADKAYNTAKKKLTSGRGNIVSRTQALKDLGARTTKNINEQWNQISEIDDQ